MATQPVNEETRHLALVPQSPAAEKFALMQRQAKTFAMSMLVPQHLRSGPPEQALANCYIALTLAEAMGEMPLIVMQNIHVINGKAGFAAKYMIARANASGKFKDDLDWEITGEGKSLAATCFATLAKSGKRVQMKVDMAMAEAEGWTKNAKYRTMPELMLRYRSASFLVNLYAPEVMLGYRTAEEIEDVFAADAPSETALTADMLTSQARTAEVAEEPVDAEVETFDQDTGEIEDAEIEPAEQGEESAVPFGDVHEDMSDEEAEAYRGRSAEPEQSDELASPVATDDTPAWAQKRDELLGMVDGATTRKELQEVDAEIQKHYAAFPDAVQDELDNAVTKKRRTVAN